MKTKDQPLFVSLTQARARRDHLAAAILGTLQEIQPRAAKERIENICCAGDGWAADVEQIARAFEDHEEFDEEPPDVRILGKVVAWIRDEERRQLKEALTAK